MLWLWLCQCSGCRTLPGPSHPSNSGTLCWGPDGLLAYGCHSVVVVVDPASVQVL